MAMRASRRSPVTAGVAAARVAPRPARARGGWPAERPIQVIVPSPPGGGTDINLRAMTSHFQRHLPGSRFVIDNRCGAGGEIGCTATPEPIRLRLEETIATIRDPAWTAAAERLFIPLQYRTARETRDIVLCEAEALRGVWQQQPWRDS